LKVRQGLRELLHVRFELLGKTLVVLVGLVGRGWHTEVVVVFEEYGG
jgi:hypothetical protein